jgi:hypothetical protein
MAEKLNATIAVIGIDNIRVGSLEEIRTETLPRFGNAYGIE